MPNIDQQNPSIQEEAPFFSTQIIDSRRFFRPVTDESNIPLKVIAGGWERCATGYSVDRSNFPYFALEFVTEGQGLLIFDNREQHLEPGSVLFYGPGHHHTIINSGHNSMTKYFATFHGVRAHFLLEEKLQLMGRVFHVADLQMVKHTFDDLIESGLDRSPLSSMICGTTVELLLLKIAGGKQEHNVTGGEAYKNYIACQSKIETEFLKLHSLHDICEECNISEAYLCRLFKRFDHQSPYRFLQHVKMTYAAGKLLESGLPVKELAFSLGFDDPFHFSRSFKQVMGVSPRAFLKMNTL